jgi:Tfp pilus assembly protein PilE
MASMSPRTRRLPPARSPAMTTVSERVRKVDRALGIQNTKKSPVKAAAPAAPVEDDDDIELQAEKKNDSSREKLVPDTVDSKLPVVSASPKKAGPFRRVISIILDYRRYVNMFLFVLMVAILAAVAYTIYNSLQKKSSISTSSAVVVSSDVSAFYLSVNDWTISASSLTSTLVSVLGTDNLTVTSISASSINLPSSYFVFNVSAGVSNGETTLRSKLSNGDSSVSSIYSLIGYDGSITYFTKSTESTPAPSTASTNAPATNAPTQAQSTDSPTSAPTQAPTEAVTAAPTEAPTEAVTEAPTEAPTESATDAPTESTSMSSP